jgi:hypothetical protein
MLQFLIFLAAIVLVVSFLPYYFHEIIGPKPGIQLNSYVPSRFPPRDFSWLIFGLIYFALIITLQGLLGRPLSIFLGLKCYLAVTILRMVTMYLFTLEPPPGIISLQDPIVDMVAYGGVVFNKDLFFSGHIATLTLLSIIEYRPLVKRLLVSITVAVALLLMIQRVHYFIDVIASPIITLAIVRVLSNTKQDEKAG